MSHQTVSINLLKKIQEFCPNVECFLIVETIFEQGSFTQFVKLFAHNLKDITISDTLKTIGSDLRCLWQNTTILGEVKVILKDYNREESPSFAQKFDVFPKSVFSLYIENDTHEDCAPGCGCKDGNDIPEQGLNQKTILIQILDNVSKHAKQLKCLRIESDECPKQLVESLNIISEFKELLSLNLTFGSKYNDYYGKSFLRNVNCFLQLKELSKIEYLTLHFCKSAVSDVLIESRRFVFKTKIITLRLIDMLLIKKDINNLVNNFKNIKNLQLIDCYFNDCQSIKLISKSKKLRKLVYQYNQDNHLFNEHHLEVFQDLPQKIHLDLNEIRSVWAQSSFIEE